MQSGEAQDVEEVAKVNHVGLTVNIVRLDGDECRYFSTVQLVFNSRLFSCDPSCNAALYFLQGVGIGIGIGIVTVIEDCQYIS